MPLVDLQTNLKSLKYGRDTTNGGSSGQPFITKDINGLTIDDLGRTGGSDLLIRGGFLLGDRVKDDVLRIGKYLSTPEGLLWSATQNVLSTSGVRIYGGYPKLAQAANVFRLNDGSYLPSSTLLQLAANPIGGHLNKQGTDPTGLSILGRPEYIKLQKELKVANLLLRGDQELNRLIKLRKDHIEFPSDGPLYTYLGGPGAGSLVGGAGTTSIRFADQRTPSYQKLNDPYFKTTASNAFSKYITTTATSNLLEVTQYGVSSTYGLNPQVNNDISLENGLSLGFGDSVINSNEFQNTPLTPTANSYPNLAFVDGVSKKAQISEATNQIQDNNIVLTLNTGLNRTPTVIQDFRATKKDKTKAPNYNGSNAKNIEKRLYLGDPGNPGINRTDYSVGSTIGQDKINNMYLYRSANVTSDPSKNDIVKFRIATIDPDEPSKSTFTHFRAFINGMSDSFGAEWDSFKYMGRGENFYNYQGFNRSVSLSWTVMAQSKNELSTQYQKLNYLASTLAPNYSAAGFMRGNIHRLTIGGYFYEYPGIIESLDFTIPDDSPWEIGIDTDGGFDSDVKELPHRINVAMSFKPIDTFLPQTLGSGLSKIDNPEGINGGGNIKQRFISLEDDSDNNNLYARGTNNANKVL